MAFPEGTPTTRIVLDEPRDLGFTLGAMRRIREKVGTLEIDDSSEDGLIESLPAYVWACMDKDGREALTVEDVEELIHPNNMAQISEALSTLFIQSAPEGAEGNVETGKKKAARR